MWKLLLVISLTCVWAGPTTVFVDPSVYSSIWENGATDIVISMQDKSSKVIETIKAQSFATRGVRINTVASTLQAHASKSQKSVLNFLATQNVTHRSFWISNIILVKNANADLIDILAAMPQVESIREDRMTPSPFFTPSLNSIHTSSEDQVVWGLEKMGVPEVWEQGYTGQGVVVGVIDSGVRGTHTRLVKNFRQERGWLDTTEGREEPYDIIGHGTIITGCLLGSGGIGVAPGAQWIACGSQYDSNAMSDMHKCAEFMLCPTHPNGTEPDCEAAPHIVTNSWGFYEPTPHFFDDALLAYEAAGIIAVFANGNNGPSCRKALYPANVGINHFSVGATNVQNKITSFSSRGPGFQEILNPNIVAPGYNITSSASDHDDAMVYGSMGTSEAAPYVAGVIALLLSNGTELSYAEVSKYIFESANPVEPSSGNCGDIPETQYPNNAAGYGQISASGALAKMLQNRMRT